MRILVTGSRDWDDRQRLVSALLEQDPCAEHGECTAECPRITVVHGACPTGADRLADEFASHWGVEVERHAPDFEQYGSPHAYHVRNREMVEAGADVVLAFFKKGAKNAGTTRTVELAEAAGLPVRRFEA